MPTNPLSNVGQSELSRDRQRANAAALVGLQHTHAGRVLLEMVNQELEPLTMTLLTEGDASDVAFMAEALGRIRALNWVKAVLTSQLEDNPHN